MVVGLIDIVSSDWFPWTIPRLNRIMVNSKPFTTNSVLHALIYPTTQQLP